FLDSAYQAEKAVQNVDSNVVFPLLNIAWSTRNMTAAGGTPVNVANGFIHGTEYNISAKTIYLQGAENFDTDEYDAHVVLHEWSHYFQQEFSRTDTLAGQHIPGDIVDPRLAFDEGFATALSSILLNNPR